MSKMKEISNKKINNLATLKQQQQLLKNQLKLQEKQLEERWQQLPKEAISASLSVLLPTFISQKIAGASIGLFNLLTKFSLKKEESGANLSSVINIAKQVGWAAVIRMAAKYIFKGK